MFVSRARGSELQSDFADKDVILGYRSFALEDPEADAFLSIPLVVEKAGLALAGNLLISLDDAVHPAISQLDPQGRI